MSKFKKKVNTKQEIPTSSMPDVVFMLLFFFMVTTKMRETNINVEQHMPQAEQLQTLAKKSLISYLYIGTPKKIDQFGKEPTDLNHHPNSPGYRLILNNILFPAA